MTAAHAAISACDDGARRWKSDEWEPHLHKRRIDHLRLERVEVDLASGDLGLEEGIELARVLVDVERGILDPLDLGEKLVHRARHHRLGSASRARDDDSANLRVDGAEQQRGLDGLLADDGGKRIDRRSGGHVGHRNPRRRCRLGCLHVRVHLLKREPRSLGGIRGRRGAREAVGARGTCGA
eukprot:scaffold237010_cov27-Tisochrysis_lutea.AAC.2